MKTIQEIAKEFSEKRTDLKSVIDSQKDKQEHFNSLASLMADVSDYLVEELKCDNKIEITNYPKEQEVKVTNFRGIFGLLESISKTIKSFKLPNIFNIKGTVSVDNFPKIEIPQTVIPDYPTEIDANVDFSNILTKLDEVSKCLSSIELSPKIEVQNQAPEVSIDLESVKSGLESIVEEIKRIQVTPEVKIDLESLENSVNKTTQAIQALRFPIPNFQSSWQHSRDMQSKDLPTTYSYKTVAAKKVIDYIEITANDGVYRRTYTYDTDGTTDIVAKSAWIKQ